MEYHSKFQTILDDQTKFKKLTKNPINQLKTQVNKLITANNADCNSIKLQSLETINLDIYMLQYKSTMLILHFIQ